MTAFKQTITPAIVDLIIKAGEGMADELMLERISINYELYCPICGADDEEDCGCFADIHYGNGN